MLFVGDDGSSRLQGSFAAHRQPISKRFTQPAPYLPPSSGDRRKCEHSEDEDEHFLSTCEGEDKKQFILKRSKSIQRPELNSRKSLDETRQLSSGRPALLLNSSP